MSQQSSNNAHSHYSGISSSDVCCPPIVFQPLCLFMKDAPWTSFLPVSTRQIELKQWYKISVSHMSDQQGKLESVSHCQRLYKGHRIQTNKMYKKRFINTRNFQISENFQGMHCVLRNADPSKYTIAYHYCWFFLSAIINQPTSDKFTLSLKL